MSQLGISEGMEGKRTSAVSGVRRGPQVCACGGVYAFARVNSPAAAAVAMIECIVANFLGTVLNFSS
jgi:hypothetical protein